MPPLDPELELEMAFAGGAAGGGGGGELAAAVASGV